MGYMIEGGGSKTMAKAKQWLTDHSKETHELLALLTDVIVDYFEMQVKAGAQMLQVFESSADYISKEQFAEVSLPYVRQIRDRLRERLHQNSIEPVPMVIFAKGGGHSLAEQSQLGYEVIGLDWSVDPIEARQQVGPNVTLQGNFHPEDLYKPAVSGANSKFRSVKCVERSNRNLIICRRNWPHSPKQWLRNSARNGTLRIWGMALHHRLLSRA